MSGIQRKTYGQIKGSIGQAIGLCSGQEQLKSYVNEAMEILWNAGDWPLKNVRYRVRVVPDCRGNRCITWPSEIETIEMISVCGVPIGVRNIYFEQLSGGSGQIGANGYNGYNGFGGGRYWGGISLLGDRQEVCTMEDIREPSVLKVYTERIESTGQIILMGYNASGLWIRTETTPGSGVWRDGEYVDISNLTGSGASTVNVFSAVTGVQFTTQSRAGNTYLYAVDSLSEEHQLATYDYSTQIPVFRRSILSGLPRRGNETDDACDRSTCVDIIAKLRFTPVQNDTDYIQITNEAAIKCMLRAIWKRDNSKPAEYQEFKAEAISLMNDTLKQYSGYGAKKVFNFGPRQLLGAGYNMQ